MVFVIDKKKKPLSMCHEARARKLLDSGKALVVSHYPFVLRLKEEVTHEITGDYSIKIDPGSSFTGISILNGNEITFCAEIAHKTSTIIERNTERAQFRRGRRARNTRYRPPRFDNRKNKKPGWLAPSMVSRIDNIVNWVKKFMALCPIKKIVFEDVKFDTQLLMNPNIKGKEYQQGPLYRMERREYLREKTGFKCAYCKKSGTETFLQVEHVTPRSRGGSDRISNLTLACKPCNDLKGTRTATEFGFPEVQKAVSLPLKNAAVMNSSRKATLKRLKELGLPVTTGSGGLTAYNRKKQNLPKTHYFDASCVGFMDEDEKLVIKTGKVLNIKAEGRGVYRRTQVTAGVKFKLSSIKKDLEQLVPFSRVEKEMRKLKIIVETEKVNKKGVKKASYKTSEEELTRKRLERLLSRVKVPKEQIKDLATKARSKKEVKGKTVKTFEGREVKLLDLPGSVKSFRPRKAYYFGFKKRDLVKTKDYGVQSIKSVRSSGSFTLGNEKTSSYKYCKILQRCDGFSYSLSNLTLEEPARQLAERPS